MGYKEFGFGFGDTISKLSLPTEKIIHEIEGRSVAAITDVENAVKQVLRNPIGTPPLKEIVTSGDKVAIVVNDITRVWVRFADFLPILIDELNQAGIPDADMFIVIALGAHRKHTPEETEQVCGKAVCDRLKIYQHEATNPDAVTYVGTTSHGVKSYVNSRVMSADKVILTGGIVYHLMAGFGGGRKSIMPGISGYDSIQANHRLCLNKELGKGINPNCTAGKLHGNEMNEDIIEIASLVKPCFILNAILTPDGHFAKFVAGHWLEAWQKGCEMVEEMYGIPISEKADLVIASAGGYPKDINLYQSSKTIDNTCMAVKPGGVAICFLECRDILEPAEFSSWFSYKDTLKFEMALRDKFTVPGFIAFKLILAARAISLIIVSKPENIDFIRNTGMIPATTAEEALQIAKEKLGKNDFTITVMSHAANTVPLLKK